ncbi:MAG TPA: S41 family peptidase [Pseudonocardiaceae bacterium]
MKRADLLDALDVIERTALFSDTVDWAAVRGDAETVPDAHAFLTTVLKQAGGRHSHLTPPGPPRSLPPKVVAALGPPLPTGELIETVGYLRLPRLSGGLRRARDYVRTGGRVLDGLVAAHPSAWIVDLRANTGGNMWPMLAVAATLLPDGVLGHFGLPDGSYLVWSLNRGRLRLDGKRMARSHSPAHQGGDVPIAVLVSRHTASAGEAVAVAFAGLPTVRLIGAPTAGFTTGNSTHVLRDGTRLHISGSYYADRDRRRIDGPVPVDINADAALDAALSWISEV